MLACQFSCAAGYMSYYKNFKWAYNIFLFEVKFVSKLNSPAGESNYRKAESIISQACFNCFIP